MVRLIATDLDGTLFGPDLEVSKRVHVAFGRALSAGFRVVIATGRMFKSALPYAKQLELVDPVISYQGAWVRDPVSLETLWHNLLPRALTERAVGLIQASGLHLNLYTDDTLLVELITPECEWYCSQARVRPEIVASFGPHLGEVTKLVAIASAEVLNGCQAEFEKALGGDCYVIRSTPRYLEFAAQGTSKAVALAEVARRLGIGRDEVLAFGDADNDADMLAWAGTGISVGSHASAKALESADRHVEPVGDGVAQIIEELLA